MDESEKYHFITAFDSIHDLAKPLNVLRAIARSLTVGGTFLMVDIAASGKLEENLDHPVGPWLYTSSCMHCVPVSLDQGGQGSGKSPSKRFPLTLSITITLPGCDLFGGGIEDRYGTLLCQRFLPASF